MSRGPGRQQRAILEGVKDGGYLIVTHPDNPRAKQEAARRAARTLADRGLIRMFSAYIDGSSSSRLVACLPDVDAPETMYVTGKDGKDYPTARSRRGRVNLSTTN